MIQRKRCFYTALLLTMGITNTMALEISSSAFNHGGNIPKIYTCDGQNISPPLAWKDIPSNTQSFVLIMDDPDAPGGTWNHWIIYNIPSKVNGLQEGVAKLPEGALLGKNSWNKSTYGGPCPPDREHRYFFKLYALDTVLPNQSSLDSKQIEQALKDHVLASTELMAKYQRSK